MAYLGNDLQVAYSTYKNIDDISGSFNGSTTSFSLLVGGVAPVPLPLNSQQCLISVGGVIQRPDDTGSEGFRLSGGNIVFSSAPSTGEDFFGVILAGADYVNVGANFPSGSAAVPSITFDSDLDTGIYNSAANNIAIATGGTQRLVIDSSGRIGLGTSSPQKTLHVLNSGSLYQAEVRLGGTSTYYFDLTHDATTTGKTIYNAYALTGTSHGHQFQVSGTNALLIDSSGRVGIGTTSPSYKLHVVGDQITLDDSSGTANLNIGTTNNGNARLKFWEGGIGGGNAYSIGMVGASNALSFEIQGPGEVARIDSSGRLLVGTTNPNIGGGAASSTFVETAGSDHPLKVASNNASFAESGGGVFPVGCLRSASSLYTFIGCYSGNSTATIWSDKEFGLRGDGNGYADGSWIGGGADYAEYFEWSDGNPDEDDRRGISVVLDGEKIRPAVDGEDPIGVISGNPSVVGDAAWNKWSGKYLRDDFGTYIQEDYEVEDEDGNTVIQQRRKLNPAYDPDMGYISREERPEWDCVGLMGKLRIRKGQPTGSRWIKMRDISDSVEEWLVR